MTWFDCKQLNEEKIQNVCAPKEIEWNFQPPSAPHFGGAWERLVQCTKKTLKSVLQNRIVTKEALRITLVEAEGILISRPITHVSRDASDIETPTPNHFLLLRANPSNEEADVSAKEISTQRNYGDSLKRLSTSFGSALARSISLVSQRGRSGERRERI